MAEPIPQPEKQEPRRWTITRTSEVFGDIKVSGSPISGRDHGIRVMPVAEHEQAMDALRDELAVEQHNHTATLEMANELGAELAKAREITDEMVERACSAYHVWWPKDSGTTHTSQPAARKLMRAALEAVLKPGDCRCGHPGANPCWVMGGEAACASVDEAARALGIRSEAALGHETDGPSPSARVSDSDQTSAAHDALAYLADPDNWAGDPHDQTSTLHGHFTPFELARRALGQEEHDG